MWMYGFMKSVNEKLPPAQAFFFFDKVDNRNLNVCLFSQLYQLPFCILLFQCLEWFLDL